MMGAMHMDELDFLPGAAPASGPNLLVGVYATCTIDAITTLHLFDWEVRVKQNLLDASGHGDEWEQLVPHRQSWSGRARGYMTKAAVAANLYPAGMSKISGSPTVAVFTGYSDMGTGAQKIFEGQIYAEEIVLQFPNSMATQEVSFRGAMAPTAGPAT